MNTPNASVAADLFDRLKKPQKKTPGTWGPFIFLLSEDPSAVAKLQSITGIEHAIDLATYKPLKSDNPEERRQHLLNWLREKPSPWVGHVSGVDAQSMSHPVEVFIFTALIGLHYKQGRFHTLRWQAGSTADMDRYLNER